MDAECGHSLNQNKERDDKREMSSYCGRCCPERRDPPRRPPHTGPGGGGAHLDTRCTGIPTAPNRRRRSCGRLGGQRVQKKKKTENGEKLFFSVAKTKPKKTLLVPLPTSAPAVGIQVIVSRALGNTFSMMQGGPRHAAHALGVVRETGGTRRIAGCEPQRVTVNGFRSAWWDALFSISNWMTYIQSEEVALAARRAEFYFPFFVFFASNFLIHFFWGGAFYSFLDIFSFFHLKW